MAVNFTWTALLKHVFSPVKTSRGADFYADVLSKKPFPLIRHLLTQESVVLLHSKFCWARYRTRSLRFSRQTLWPLRRVLKALLLLYRGWFHILKFTRLMFLQKSSSSFYDSGKCNSSKFCSRDSCCPQNPFFPFYIMFLHNETQFDAKKPFFFFCYPSLTNHCAIQYKKGVKKFIIGFESMQNNISFSTHRSREILYSVCNHFWHWMNSQRHSFLWYGLWVCYFRNICGMFFLKSALSDQTWWITNSLSVRKIMTKPPFHGWGIYLVFPL